MINKIESPAYVKISLNLLTLGLLTTALYLGQDILLPFFFSVLLATLLHPLVNFLTRHKVNRVLAIIISIIVSLVTIGLVLYFLSHQIGNFLDDMPAIKEKLKEVVLNAKKWVQSNYNIGIREQTKYLNDTAKKMTEENSGIVQQTMLTLTGMLSYIIFLPVYTFLILYNKELIKRFLVEVFKRSEEDKVIDFLYEAQSISQSYVIGLMIECAIVFALNSAGFLILGIKYPIFLALMAALLNLIPYVGMLVANIFCMLITLVSSDGGNMNVLWVCGVLAVVQVVDNNILMPMIVGSKIKINALAIILGVVIGGTLCGVPGMFLAIPALAVMRVIFERVDGLKPYSILLGDENNGNGVKKNPVKSAMMQAKNKKDE